MIYYKINKLTSSAIAGYRNGNQVVIYNAKDGARHIKGNAEAYSKPSYSLKGACGYRRSLCSTRPRKVSPLFGSVYNPYAGINKAFPRKVFQRGGLAGVHDGRNGEATRVAPRKRNGTYNLTGINGPLYDPRWDGRHKWPSVGQDYDVFLRQGDWFTETKSGNQYQVKGFTTDNLPYYEDENGTYHVVEKENRLPEVFVVRRRRTPADDLDKFFVGMMAAPLAAYGAAELAGLGIGAGSVLESSLASQVAANAPTTTSFLLNGVRGLAAMEAGNEFGNMYARATSPYNTWGEGVAATTGMPRLLADFTNPFALASPWVFEKGAKALYNAGERAVGEGWNLLSRQGNSYARARQLSNAMNNNVKGARLSVGEPRGGTAGYYTPTTKESPATISWENAISSDNNMGSSSLLQRDNFGMNDVRYFGEGENASAKPSFEFIDDPIQMHLMRAKAKGFDTDGIKIIDLSKDTPERSQALQEFGRRYGAYDEGATDEDILKFLLDHADNHGHAFADMGGSRLVFHDGKGTNMNARISHEMDHVLHNPKGTISEDIFADSFLEELHKLWDKEGVSNVETELAARGSQIHDYLGHTGNEPITVKDLEYVRDHYAQDTGLDNDIVKLINNTKDLNKLAKWMTKYATIFSVPIILNKNVE